MNEELLKNKVSVGASIQDLATEFNKSKGSIKFWLKKYNLKTFGKSGQKTLNTGKDTLTHKICVSCKIDKPAEDFGFRKDRGTLQSYCRSCDNIKTLQREYENKKDCIDYLGGKCKRCGITGHEIIFDFHHSN